jgi:hypothetical protein
MSSGLSWELDAAVQNRRLDSEKPEKCEILPQDCHLEVPDTPRNPLKGKWKRFHSLKGLGR